MVAIRNHKIIRLEVLPKNLTKKDRRLYTRIDYITVTVGTYLIMGLTQCILLLRRVHFDVCVDRVDSMEDIRRRIVTILFFQKLSI